MCRVKEPNAPAKKFNVAIIEALRKTVEVEADNTNQAEQMVCDAWHNSEYILGAEDFIGVEFKAESVDD